MSEKPKSFPWEGSDFPKKRGFYPESLKPDNTTAPEDHLGDEGVETGNPGDLGGGYNSLKAGEIPPPKPENPHWPTDEERRIGKEGVIKAREALEQAAEANNAEPENQDPS